MSTKIEWTEDTWSPLLGCRRVSPGCGVTDAGGCYAERMARRLSGPGRPYEGLVRGTSKGPRWTGARRTMHDRMTIPLRRKKPTMYFVNSMGDLFFEGHPYEDIAAVFGVMAACPQHTFQCLTKRDPRPFFRWLIEQDRETNGGTPGRLCCIWQALRNEAEHHPDSDSGPLHTKHCADPDGPWPLPNVWIGVSAEDQQRADERIPWLLDTPAAVRFVSAEPLLGPIDFTRVRVATADGLQPQPTIDALRGVVHGPDDKMLPGIDQVIAGSESGPKARPAQEDWYRSIRDQCREAGVAYFLKQWAENGRKISLPVLDGEQHAEFPEVRHG